MKNSISIIIPCYQSEKTLDNCIEQLLKQTNQNFEAIFIDDGSTDKTYEKIKEAEKKYDFVRAYKNETNKGAGYTRNRGIEYASFDIIAFLDSDDEISAYYYEKLLSTMIKGKYDLVYCDFFVKFSQKSTTEVNFRVDLGGNTKKITKNIVLGAGLAAAGCNKLFKKELIQKNQFAEGIINEDIPAVLGSIIDAKKIGYTNEVYYTYIQQRDSVQNSNFSFKKFDVFKAVKILEERKKAHKDYIENKDAIIFHQIIEFFMYMLLREPSFKKRYKYLKEFNKQSKEYNIRQNPYFWNFLNNQRKLIRYYYKFVFKLNCNGLHFLTNILVQLYQKLLARKRQKTLIMIPELKVDDIVKWAKKNQEQSDYGLGISVVIPNYNYEKYLLDRLYSVFYQQVKIKELILLDDCSKDNSRELLDVLEKKLSPILKVKKLYNKTNSGTAFKQWEKGFENATSDYVWIAEVDDYCHPAFLNELIQPILRDRDVVLSYCDTSFINIHNNIVMKTVVPLIDLMKTGHWNRSYTNSGIDEIKNYSFLNCTIANVSSVLFKNKDYSKELKESGTYRQVGDWLFYINVIKDGKISFSNKRYNYCRLHDESSTAVTKKQLHFDEIKVAHQKIKNQFTIDKKYNQAYQDRYQQLVDAWGVENNK